MTVRWTQLGLWLESQLPVRIDPKPKRKSQKSKSAPVRKENTKRAKLAPGELDDPLDDIF